MTSRADPPLAQQFREHFGHRDHLYGVMLAEMADDLDRGGPTALICEGYAEAPRGQAVQLRLLAGIFRIVLRGQAPQLAPFYPSLGGTADAQQVWPALEPVLREHAEELHDALSQPPQTNEVGRPACLAIGLFEAVRCTGLSSVRLLELGASAGLNLNVDLYRCTGPDWAWGPPDSPVALDTEAHGVRPEELQIISRRGCDLSPVVASTPEGGRYLTSFVWPFDRVRHRRLAAALQVVRDHRVVVDRAPASQWLEEQTAVPVPDGVLTVVWQSITRQYWPPVETDRVNTVITEARSRMPLAHITMEGVPPRQAPTGYNIMREGPILSIDGRTIAHSHHHGPPVVME